MRAEKRKNIPNYIIQKPSPENVQASPEQVKKKKRKLQNSYTKNVSRELDILVEVNDADENLNETQNTVDENPKEGVGLRNELTFISTMNQEEVNNHIQKCLEMSSENKITPKNAFALQLIDCMNLLLQKEDFSVMACTLDAGQKIYGYRVDGLHQQVVKLAEEVIKNQQKNKLADTDNTNSDESLKKDTRKARKKNILVSSESLKRTLRGKDPKEKFIKIDGAPGAIMSSVKRDPKDLSFTLENNVQFWNDWSKYKPLTVKGTQTIPQCEIYRNGNDTRKKENLLRYSPSQEITEICNQDKLTVSDDESVDIFIDEPDLSDSPVEIEGSEKNNSVEEEVEVISTALKRMTTEVEENRNICSVPTRFDMMKIIFNKSSDYHYLNMEKAYYWAGPEFWKRTKMSSYSKSQDKKKVSRKKKVPSSITYSEPEAEKIISEMLKKGSTLNKKTIMGWKMKHVTYAKDLKVSVKQFLNLHNMEDFFETEEISESREKEISEFEGDYDDNDATDDVAISNSFNSQDPLNSSFYENAPENTSSHGDRDPLNSAFYDAGLSQAAEIPSEDSGKIVKVRFSGNNDEESLVPAPKVINFQPIKYKTRPIRVDMQHLKNTMWSLINEDHYENREDTSCNGDHESESGSGTRFSKILNQLPPNLEERTAKDLSPGMALLALLTLANENNLHLKNTEDFSDVVISLENNNPAVGKYG